MREIVAAKIGTTITNDITRVIVAIQDKKISELYDRAQMEFMASCDLGENWNQLARGKTLFLIDSNNTIHSPS